MAEQNITSVLDKDQATNISLDNFIYLIQGYGANRDRWATLKQLFDADVLSRIEVKNVELTAGKSITISKDYNLVLVDNNQNSGAVLTVNTPSDQSYRGVLDVVVRWRDQQTERIGISIGNGTYYLHPQNNEWGRFFVGAEGRVWSHNVSVTDYTVAEEYSGSGTHQNIPREWKVGKKGLLFKASNSGTTKEVELYFNGNWVLSGLESIESNLDIGTAQAPANLKVTGTSDLGSEAKSDLFKADEITAKTGGDNGTITTKAQLEQEKQSKIAGFCFRGQTNDDTDGLWLASNHGAIQELYNKTLPNRSMILVVNDTEHRGSNVNVTIQYQNGVTLVLTPNQSKLFYRMADKWWPVG